MSSQLPAVLIPAFIPSPSQGVWHLGPLPLRAYAICILIGIFAGYWLGRRRWVARGGTAEVLADIMFWAIPFGLIGARIYHVLTDWNRYFGSDGDPVEALKIWHGGLGIWGAIGFGALGAWIACRRHKVPFLAVADAMAPGIALAQVFGRFGNYFNQELFGRPTTHWWGLEIAFGNRPAGYEQFATFHPTFLYEAIWNLGVIALIILVGRRYTLGHGRAFALYAAGYTAGRGWIETLRIDTADHIAGVRLNVFTSIIIFVLAVVFFILSARLRPGQEDISGAKPAAPTPDSESAEASDVAVGEGASTPSDDAGAATPTDDSAASGSEKLVDAEGKISREGEAPGADDPAEPGAGDPSARDEAGRPKVEAKATSPADAAGSSTPSTTPSDGSRD
ncbi:MAG TPA: prolipoprotein diacylglyceryl transferase [Asanoa sp.]|nr:prolipoprotein diacylglyceryl transferase [Asanoa sp.]